MSRWDTRYRSATKVGQWFGSAYADPVYSAFDSIATITVGAAGTSSEVFTSIPQGYTHLQLRWFSRSSGGAYNPTVRFNSDSGNNYTWHYLDGNGTSVNVGGSSATNSILMAGIVGTAGVFATGIMDILDYRNTNKHKTVRVFQGNDNAGSGGVDLWSGCWMSTSAITSINLQFASAQYSHYALYGIKG